MVGCLGHGVWKEGVFSLSSEAGWAGVAASVISFCEIATMSQKGIECSSHYLTLELTEIADGPGTHPIKAGGGYGYGWICAARAPCASLPAHRWRCP